MVKTKQSSLTNFDSVTFFVIPRSIFTLVLKFLLSFYSGVLSLNKHDIIM